MYYRNKVIRETIYIYNVYLWMIVQWFSLEINDWVCTQKVMIYGWWYFLQFKQHVCMFFRGRITYNIRDCKNIMSVLPSFGSYRQRKYVRKNLGSVAPWIFLIIVFILLKEKYIFQDLYIFNPRNGSVFGDNIDYWLLSEF